MLWELAKNHPIMKQSKKLLPRKAVKLPRFDENFHLLSAGNVNDNLVAPALLQGLNLKNKVVLADKAYSDAKIDISTALHSR